MRYRGSVNRRTGKTTPRNKAKTHWRAKRGATRSPNPGTPGKPEASSASKGSP